MQTRFGFIASDKLINLIKEAHQALESDVKDMYKYRNSLIEQVSDEIIQNMILDIADRVSDPERKEHINKLGHKIQGVVHKVVKVMLSKDKNKIVLQSKPFLEDSVAKDAEGNIRMGFAVSEEFYENAQTYFAKIAAGEDNDAMRKQIKSTLNKLDDMLLSHFIVDFVKTLGWGAIKMNLAKGTKATISKADSMMLDQMLGKLSLEQLQELLPHFEELLFKSDITGLDVLS